jgi:hypothetical protein
MTTSAGVAALLFTDLVRSTELLTSLGDDAADELRLAGEVLRASPAPALVNLLGRALRNSDPGASREAFDEAIALFERRGAGWRRDQAAEARP